MLSLEDRRRKLEQLVPVWKKKTIFHLFRETASLYPLRYIYQDEKRSVTYADALEETERVRASFLACGIQRGDRVAVNLSNVAEYIYITFALASIGAVKVPVNRRSSLKQKNYVLNMTGAVLFLTDREEDLRCVRDCQKLIRIIKLGTLTGEDVDISGWDDFIRVGPLREDGRTGQRKVSYDCQADADDLSDIIFTSGSTGNPKGVMLSHDMMLRSAYANCINRGFEDERKVLVTVPLFHVFGYVEGLLSILFVGGCLVCIQGRFDVRKTLSMIQDKEADDILCVPSVMQKILIENTLSSYDLHSLHAVYCSASACPGWVWDAISDTLGIHEITNGYGMSEVSGASVQTPVGRRNHHLQTSVGKVLRDHFPDSCKLVEYRVIDPDTQEELAIGSKGELVCRGAIVTKGYFNEPEATKAAFTDDGWFRSGDCGSIDSEGFVFFEGRLNESYKINGENVSPCLLDHAIFECRDVVQVETVGIPDERLGWVGVAFIEPVDYRDETKENIVRYCRDHLASFEVPKHFLFIQADQWPRTSNGKITKKMLRDKAIQIISSKE